MDPSAAPANTATSFGSIETCAQVNENNIVDADEDAVDTLDIDVIVGSIPPYDSNSNTGGAFAFAFLLNYSAPDLSVISSDFANYIISSAEVSSPLNTSEAVPDTDGVYDAGVVNLGSPTSAVVVSGSGVIGRFGLRTNASAAFGIYDLFLSNAGYLDGPAESRIPANSVGLDLLPPAKVAVDTGCPLPSDLSATAISITVPAESQSAGLPFDVTVDATVHNIGPLSAANGLVHLWLSLPADCSTSSVNPALLPVSLPLSVEVDVGPQTFSVVCSTDGIKSFHAFVGIESDGDEPDSNPVDNTSVSATADFEVLEPVDSDGDGVLDPDDLCPGTAPADPVDANGCSDPQVDPDGDGFCSPGAPSSGPSGCTGSDNCPDDANPAQENFDGDALGDACDPDDDNDAFSDVDEAGMPLCGDGRNEDSHDDAVVDDGCPGGPPQDGQFSEAQFNIGTDPLDPCGTDGWPIDLVEGGVPDSTNRVDLQDLTSFLAPARRFDTSPGDTGFNQRWDLSPGKGVFAKWINIEDLTRMLTGMTGYPPILGGARAFGGPECPFPP